ncbi:hypothetical protein [Tardiphaga sp. 285_C5_N1_2]|uniref:hypothetical protein n=1 Tax=Tardiphaga sp. 285_C5_N1_2 TaxID=3240775 RepID=UPI003F8C9785
MQLRAQDEIPGVGTPLQIDEHIWTPARPSLGSRHPALRSRYSSTGFIVEDGRVVNFESRPERFAGEAFSMDPDISFFLEQPPKIGYWDDNRYHHHTFDYFTVRTSAIRTLTAIKHSSQVEQSGIRRILKLISEQAGRKSADEIALMTELDFSPSERFNAELVHETRRYCVPEHDERVRQATAAINGIVTIRDVVALSGLGGSGFRAVVRLIADRFFQLADRENRIELNAPIRRRCPFNATVQPKEILT